MIREFINSGIEWVGKIPSNWKVVPNKRVMFKVKNICERYNDEDVLSLTMNGVIKRDLENPSGKMPESFDGYQYIRKDNLIMCLFDMDVTPRCIGLSNYDGVTSPAYTQFELFNKKYNRYYYYYYLYLDNTKELLHLSKNLRSSITDSQLGEIHVPLPNEDEAIKIADYLDNKCNIIEQIIADNNKEIELLEEYKINMYDNACLKGIRKHEYVESNHYSISKYPRDWKFTKTLYALSMPITDGPHETPNLITDGIPFISAEAIKNGRIDFTRKRGFISKEDYDKYSLKYKPQINDIYMIKSGGTTGKVGIVDTNDIFNIWSPLGVFRADKEKMYYKYLFYLLQTSFYQQQVQLNWSYGTQQNIGMRTLEKLKILVPSLDEQKEIANYLESTCSKINEIIEYRMKIIEKLEEYKKSLIYEVVTGKKEV